MARHILGHNRIHCFNFFEGFAYLFLANLKISLRHTIHATTFAPTTSCLSLTGVDVAVGDDTDFAWHDIDCLTMMSDFFRSLVGLRVSFSWLVVMLQLRFFLSGRRRWWWFNIACFPTTLDRGIHICFFVWGLVGALFHKFWMIQYEDFLHFEFLSIKHSATASLNWT